MKNFDPAAKFLLDLNYTNLFEDLYNSLNVRCKGCEMVLLRSEREGHWLKHREERELEVAQTRRENAHNARQSKKEKDA